jgi:hypothetical protein
MGRQQECGAQASWVAPPRDEPDVAAPLWDANDAQAGRWMGRESTTDGVIEENWRDLTERTGERFS